MTFCHGTGWDRAEWDFDSLSRPVPGQVAEQKGKKSTQIKKFAKKKKLQFLTFFDIFFANQVVILSRDVPGQRSLSQDF